jgi:Ca2+-binding RTX toxin-like protein
MVIDGGNENTRIFGNDENDNIYGEGGNDTIAGGQGSNYLSGGDGNDYLIGANGMGANDTLTGGSGSDIYLISNLPSGISSDNDIFVLDYSTEDSISFSLNFGTGTSYDELTDVHYGLGDSTLTFIQDQNNEIIATISGDPYFL